MLLSCVFFGERETVELFDGAEMPLLLLKTILLVTVVFSTPRLLLERLLCKVSPLGDLLLEIHLMHKFICFFISSFLVLCLFFFVVIFRFSHKLFLV